MVVVESPSANAGVSRSRIFLQTWENDQPIQKDGTVEERTGPLTASTLMATMSPATVVGRHGKSSDKISVELLIMEKFDWFTVAEYVIAALVCVGIPLFVIVRIAQHLLGF